MSDWIMPTKQFCTNDEYSTTLFILGPLMLPGNTSSRNPARLFGLKNEYIYIFDQKIPKQLVGSLLF